MKSPSKKLPSPPKPSLRPIQIPRKAAPKPKHPAVVRTTWSGRSNKPLNPKPNLDGAHQRTSPKECTNGEFSKLGSPFWKGAVQFWAYFREPPISIHMCTYIYIYSIYNIYMYVYIHICYTRPPSATYRFWLEHEEARRPCDAQSCCGRQKDISRTTFLPEKSFCRIV